MVQGAKCGAQSVLRRQKASHGERKSRPEMARACPAAHPLLAALHASIPQRLARDTLAEPRQLHASTPQPLACDALAEPRQLHAGPCTPAPAWVDVHRLLRSAWEQDHPRGSTDEGEWAAYAEAAIPIKLGNTPGFITAPSSSQPPQRVALPVSLPLPLLLLPAPWHGLPPIHTCICRKPGAGAAACRCLALQPRYNLPAALMRAPLLPSLRAAVSDALHANCAPI